MIDAARKSLDEGKIDSYEMRYGGPGFIVTVTSGKSVGEGQADTEEKAYQAAQRNLKKD